MSRIRDAALGDTTKKPFYRLLCGTKKMRDKLLSRVE